MGVFRGWAVGGTLAVVVLLFGVAAPAEACTCVAGPLCQELWLPGAAQPAYFEATVDAIEPVQGGMYLVRLRDIRTVYGRTATAVLTNRFEESCGFTFAVGERYFIDAAAQDDGSFSTSRCSKTTPRAQAGPLIDYLERLARPATGGRIFGGAHSDLPVVSMFDDNDRQPLAKLRVTLSGPVTRRAVTRADGSYSFDGLPPGQYRLSAEAPAGMALITPLTDAVILPNARACVDQRILYERPRR